MAGAPAVLFLDLGNVVVRWHFDRLCRNLAALAELAEADIRRCIAATRHDPDYVEGKIDTATFIDRLGHAVGRRFEPDAFAVAWNDVFDRDPAMEALVAEVAAVLPTFALSNTNALHFEWLQANVPALGHFRAIVASHEVGVQKPDPRIYAAACRAAGCRPAEALFVDDLAANVAGAEAAGMRARQFTGAAALRRTLAALGVAVSA